MKARLALIGILVALGVAGLIVGFAARGGGSSASGEAAGKLRHGSATHWSERGLYAATIASLLDPIRINKLHAWRIHLETADGRSVDGAKIAINVVWPHTGGPMQTKPRVKGLGNGNYLIEGIKLQMKDFWRVNFNIAAAGRSDSLTYTLLVEDVPGNSELSAVRLSPGAVAKPRRGLFLGFPWWGIGPIAINQLHDWVFQLVTPDGRPVEGARITIDGDMPAHGHGLPTQPRVTQDIGNGFYLIEGMRFQMAGKWQLSFFVNAAGKSDELVYDFVIR